MLPLIGAAIGAIGSMSAANKTSAAMDRQNEAALAGFNQYRPYVDAALKGGEGALKGVLDRGSYTGPTLAGPNNRQLDMMDRGYGFANNAVGYGSNLMNTGAAYGSNAADLYNRGLANSDAINSYTDRFNDVVNNNNRISRMTEGLAGDMAGTADAYGGLANDISNARGGYADASAAYNDLRSGYGDLNKGFGNLGNQFGGLANDMRGYESKFGGLADQNQNLTDRFTGLADSASSTDRLAAANDYAQANAGSIVDSMMRDDRRNLEENTLTGINQRASGSGNVNSSRAGIADAVANRGFEDRRMDTMATVQNQLRDQSLNQQNKQFDQTNTALNNAGSSIANTGNQFTNSMGTLTNQGNMLTNQGNSMINQGNMLTNEGNMVTNAANMTTNDINAMVTEGNMIGNRGTALGSTADMLNSSADRYGTGLKDVTGNIMDANSALSTAGTANNTLGNAFTTGYNTGNSGFGMGMGIGDRGMGFDQDRINDDRANFERNRDFEYNMYKDYMGGMLGKAPNTTNATYQPNLVNPMMSGLSGAMTGFGLANQYGPQIGNMIGNSPLANPLFGGPGLGLSF